MRVGKEKWVEECGGWTGSRGDRRESLVGSKSKEV